MMEVICPVRSGGRVLCQLTSENAFDEFDLPQFGMYFVKEVGQTAATWRYAHLQAVNQTSADSSRLTEDGKPQATASR